MGFEAAEGARVVVKGEEEEGVGVEGPGAQPMRTFGLPHWDPRSVLSHRS